MRLIFLVAFLTSCTRLPDNAYQAYELSRECREALYKLPQATPVPVPTSTPNVALEACEARLSSALDDAEYYRRRWAEFECE